MSCTPERADPGETGWKDYLGRIERRRAEIRGQRELSREPEDLPEDLPCSLLPRPTTFKGEQLLAGVGGLVLFLFILTSN